MTKQFDTQYKIRYYECNPYGHLDHANYLRFAVQAAMEAATTADYDPINGDTRWQLREVGVNYSRPVELGDALTVRTWMSNWRDKGLSLEHDFLVEGESAAKIYGDWEVLSIESLEPIHIPASLLHVFYPDHIPPESPARVPFPEPPDAPAGAFTAHRQIRWGLLNPNGWLDDAHFVAIADEVDMDASAYLGWTPQRLDEGGFTISAEDFHLECITPVLWGADLRITTYLDEVDDLSFVRHYLFDTPELGPVARAYARRVWKVAETGEPTDIPDEWLQDFADQIAEA